MNADRKIKAIQEVINVLLRNECMVSTASMKEVLNRVADKKGLEQEIADYGLDNYANALVNAGENGLDGVLDWLYSIQETL